MECTTPLNNGRLVNIAWMVSLMVCNDAKCFPFILLGRTKGARCGVSR